MSCHASILVFSPQLIPLLLNANADITAADGEFGRSALAWAVAGGHRAAAEELISHRAALDVSYATALQ